MTGNPYIFSMIMSTRSLWLQMKKRYVIESDFRLMGFSILYNFISCLFTKPRTNTFPALFDNRIIIVSKEIEVL